MEEIKLWQQQLSHEWIILQQAQNKLNIVLEQQLTIELYLSSVEQLVVLCHSFTNQFNLFIKEEQVKHILNTYYKIIQSIMKKLNIFTKTNKNNNNNNNNSNSSKKYNGLCEKCNESINHTKIEKMYTKITEKDNKNELQKYYNKLEQDLNKPLFSEQQDTIFFKQLQNILQKKQQILKINDNNVIKYINNILNNITELNECNENYKQNYNLTNKYYSLQYIKNIDSLINKTYNKKISLWISNMFKQFLNIYLKNKKFNQKNQSIQTDNIQSLRNIQNQDGLKKNLNNDKDNIYQTQNGKSVLNDTCNKDQNDQLRTNCNTNRIKDNDQLTLIENSDKQDIKSNIINLNNKQKKKYRLSQHRKISNTYHNTQLSSYNQEILPSIRQKKDKNKNKRTYIMRQSLQPTSKINKKDKDHQKRITVQYNQTICKNSSISNLQQCTEEEQNVEEQKLVNDKSVLNISKQRQRQKQKQIQKQRQKQRQKQKQKQKYKQKYKQKQKQKQKQKLKIDQLLQQQKHQELNQDELISWKKKVAQIGSKMKNKKHRILQQKHTTNQENLQQNNPKINNNTTKKKIMINQCYGTNEEQHQYIFNKNQNNNNSIDRNIQKQNKLTQTDNLLNFINLQMLNNFQNQSHLKINQIKIQQNINHKKSIQLQQSNLNSKYHRIFKKSDLLLFINEEHAYNYETSLVKNGHNNKHITSLNTQQLAQICQMYHLMQTIKNINPQIHHIICSFIRYPYQTVINDFSLLNVVKQFTLSTLHHYFQRILYLHRHCQQSKLQIFCQHIQNFTIKLKNIYHCL